MKGFGAFYNYVCARLKGYRLSKRRLDLLGDAELVKYRHVLAVQLDSIAAIGGDLAHIVMTLFKHFSIVDMNALKVGIEDVPNLADGTALFFIHE